MAPRTLNLLLDGTWDTGVVVVATVGGTWWTAGRNWIRMVYDYVVMGDRMDIVTSPGTTITWHRDL